MRIKKLKSKPFLMLLIFLSGALSGIGFYKIFLHKNKSSIEKRIGECSGSSCHYANPLLECEQYQGGDRNLDLVKSKLKKFIATKIRENSATEIAVYIRDLNNGPWIGIGEKERFAPGSLLKVPIMISYFKLAETEPEILNKKILYEKEIDNPYQLKNSESLRPGNTYTVSELIYRMIIYSDNVAKELLLMNIDKDDLLKTHIDLHLEIPDIRKPDDFISVKEYASFFRILYNASYLNRTMSEKALEILTEVYFKDGIVAGVPPNIKAAHKYGICRQGPAIKQVHDCGIVYYPKSPYLLCVMTKGIDVPVLEEITKEISRIVYEHKKKYSSQ